MVFDAVVLAIDAERERISLGIKQIEPQGITNNLAAGGGGLYPNVGIIA